MGAVATISESSKIKLGLVVAIVGVGINIALTVQGLRDDVAKLKEFQSQEAWTITAEAESLLRTAIENPGIRFPDPRNPGTIIVVDRARVLGGDDSRATTGD